MLKFILLTALSTDLIETHRQTIAYWKAGLNVNAMLSSFWASRSQWSKVVILCLICAIYRAVFKTKVMILANHRVHGQFKEPMKRRILDEAAKQLEHVHFSKVLKLKVGGQFFSTTLATLDIACRTGVIFCVFQGNRGESEAKARRARVACEGKIAKKSLALLPSHFALASLSPLLARNTQKITPVLQARHSKMVVSQE